MYQREKKLNQTCKELRPLKRNKTIILKIPRIIMMMQALESLGLQEGTTLKKPYQRHIPDIKKYIKILPGRGCEWLWISMNQILESNTTNFHITKDSRENQNNQIGSGDNCPRQYPRPIVPPRSHFLISWTVASWNLVIVAWDRTWIHQPKSLKDEWNWWNICSKNEPIRIHSGFRRLTMPAFFPLSIWHWTSKSTNLQDLWDMSEDVPCWLGRIGYYLLASGTKQKADAILLEGRRVGIKVYKIVLP